MGLKTVLRKLLGLKGVCTLRNIVGGVCTALNVVDPPDKFRERGVSAVVWSKNEELWIEVSMRSVSELVDEYVLIDSSTDRTPEIALNVGKELGIPVKIVRTHTSDMAEVGNLGLKKSRYKLILKWDPDFILHERYVPLVKKIIEMLNESRRYYLVYWPHVCLDGDLFHQSPISPLHIEHWLFTYHPKLKYTYIRWLEHLNVPSFYSCIYIDKPLSFHLRTVKQPVRILYRRYWYEARRKGILEKINLDEYVRKRIIEDFGTDDVEEAAKIFLERYKSKLIPYDKERYGDYPEILKKYVKKVLNIDL